MLARLLGALALLAFLAASCSNLPDRGRDSATVSVGQPKVYRRERSLIERFEDLEWLRLQRSPAKETEYEQGFQGSSRAATYQFTGLALEAKIGEVLAEAAAPPATEGTPPTSSASTTAESDPVDPPPAEGGAPPAAGETTPQAPAPTETGAQAARDVLAALRELDPAVLGQALEKLNAEAPSLSPRDKLLNRIAFRDTASEAIRRSSLDDVHDLEGMALYELQFDLSLLPGEDAGEAYAVMLEVCSDDPQELEPDMKVRVADVLRAMCLAEIAETSARIASDQLTVGDSEEAAEAHLRAGLAARHVDMMRLLGAMEGMSRQLEGELATLRSSGLTFKKVAKRRPDLDGLRTRLKTWQGKTLTAEEVRHRIVGLGDLELVRDEALDMARAFDRELRALSRRCLEVERAKQEARLALPASLEWNERERARLREALDWSDSVAATVLQWFSTTAASLRDEEGTRRAVTGLEDSFQALQAFGQLDERKASSPQDFSVAPTAISVPDLPSSVRTPAESLEFEGLLKKLTTDTLLLDEATVDRIEVLLAKAAASSRAEFAGPAVGYALARSYGKRAGAWPLTYADGYETSGLDPRRILPKLLPRSASCWPDLEASPARVVSVSPSELAEQLTTSAYSDVRSAFSLALQGLFTGTVTTAAGDFQRLSQELRRYELIGRNPLLVGFVGGGDGGAAPRSFGWLLGPRLETTTRGKAELRYRHGASHHSVTATVIAPAHYGELKLTYQVHRMKDDGSWEPARASVGSQENGKRTITLDLPASPEVIAQGLLSRERWTASLPRIFAARPRARGAGEGGADPFGEPLWTLRAKDKDASIVILGSNLWRNPQVYVGGQRATRVQILSDLGGLWAGFDQVQEPASRGSDPVRLDLVVSTSRGTDRLVNAVEIVPARPVKPPEPKLGPPLQVHAIEVIAKDPQKGHLARFSPSFELTPPLPSAWHELRVRARWKNALANAFELPIAPDGIQADPKKPGAFRIRDLELAKAQPWGPTETLELSLQLVDRRGASPRDLAPKPAEVVLIRAPLAFTAETPVAVKKEGTEWRVAEDTQVKLLLAAPIQPEHLALLFTGLKPGEPQAVRATVGSQPLQGAELSIDKDRGFRGWTLKVPKGSALGQNLSSPLSLLVEGLEAPLKVDRLTTVGGS